MIALFAVSWSGGKDCCLAFWKALSDGIDVQYLLNTFREDSGRVAFHGVRAGLIQKQADAVGRKLVQKRVSDGNYEEIFLGALEELKARSVEGIVFGDIDVRENRAWSETVARKAGLESMFPLWNQDQESILEDFIASGFKAIVVALDSRFLTEDDLGQKIDRTWMERIKQLRSAAPNAPVTFCGENGEYHSFVYGGPPFKSDIHIRTGDSVVRDGYRLIDVLDSE